MGVLNPFSDVGKAPSHFKFLQTSVGAVSVLKDRRA